MEIRKFIVTVHEDGSITVVEYIPPEDQSLANYQKGCKDTKQRVENLLSLEIMRAEHNAILEDYGPLWKDAWQSRASGYKFLLEQIRQNI